MLYRKAVYNGLKLELDTPFDFELRAKLGPLSLVDKQMCFEIHHYL